MTASSDQHWCPVITRTWSGCQVDLLLNASLLPCGTRNLTTSAYFGGTSSSSHDVTVYRYVDREKFLNRKMSEVDICSCGHTTDFYLGRADLIHRGFCFTQAKNRLLRFSRQLNFLERKFKKARCAGISLLFLTPIQRARWRKAKTQTTCAIKISFTAWGMSGFVIVTADERLLASNLGISFFPSYCFGVAVKGNSIVFETYPRPRW